MRKRNGRSIQVEIGSGNIYADLGLPNPEERLAKARLMHLITDEIERRGLTQGQAADLVGLSEPDVSDITHGRGRAYPIEALMGVLHHLGIETSIIAHGSGVDAEIPVYART